MHSGQKEKGLEAQGTLTKIKLVWSELAFGIILMDPEEVVFIHISLSLSHILMLSLSNFSTWS